MSDHQELQSFQSICQAAGGQLGIGKQAMPLAGYGIHRGIAPHDPKHAKQNASPYYVVLGRFHMGEKYSHGVWEGFAHTFEKPFLLWMLVSSVGSDRHLIKVLVKQIWMEERNFLKTVQNSDNISLESWKSLGPYGN